MLFYKVGPSPSTWWGMLTTSTDDGKTWRHVQNLETDPDAGYAYTSIAFHRDRVLLSYYVADTKGRWSSRFRSLPVRLLYAAPK